MKKVVFLFLALVFCSKSFAASFNQIIFFGDSLTDNGNLYRILKTIPQSPPYYNGRFSNGPTWAENVARYYQDKNAVQAQNYALGGATAILHDPKTDTFKSTITLPGELYSYYWHSLFTDKSGVLYVIWMGANDYLYDMTPNVDQLTDAVVNKIAWAVTSLVKQGATRFVILNLPDFSVTPFGRATDIDEQTRLHRLAELHNKKLHDKIQALQQQYPAVQFLNVDIYSILNDVIAHPKKYNDEYGKSIDNLTEACLTDGTSSQNPDVEKSALEQILQKAFMQENHGKLPDGFDASSVSRDILNSPLLAQTYRLGKAYHVCSDPDQHVFWDGGHPSAAMHQILGGEVVKQIEAGFVS